MHKLALRDVHEELGAKFFEFAGWEMPMRYTNSPEEALSVRNEAGVFDVSHMGRFLIKGSEASEFLQRATSNNVDVDVGRSRYTLTLNEMGGIMDDDMAFRLSTSEYIFVTNASNREKIYRWFNKLIDEWNLNSEVEDITFETVMLAIQGPKAREIFHKITDKQLNIKKFQVIKVEWEGEEIIVSRTGYTGEDGYEVILRDRDSAAELLMKLVKAEVRPCGLVARDILRLEAGLVLYDNDISEEVNPIEAGLEFALDLSKEYFIGKESLLKTIERGVDRVRVGLVSETRRAPRRGEGVYLGEEEVGFVTSGTFSPTIERGIGMAYLKRGYAEIGRELHVGVEREIKVKISKMPFYDERIYGWRRSTSTSPERHD